MLLPVFVLTFLVAIPNTLAGHTLLEGVTLLSARRTHLRRGRGPTFRRGFGFIILSFHRFTMEPSCSAAAAGPSFLVDVMVESSSRVLVAVVQQQIRSQFLSTFRVSCCY